MDQRAQRLISAAREVLPRLDELLGAQAADVRQGLTAVVQGATESWQAEAIREILFAHKPTRDYLERAAPESRTPRPFEGTEGAGERGVLFF